MPKDYESLSLLDIIPMALPLVSSFLDSSGSVFLAILDPGGRLRYANAALVKCLKIDCHEMTGEYFSDFLTEPDGISLAERLSGTDAVSDEVFLLNLVDADQVPHTLRVRIATLEDGYLMLGEPPKDDNQTLQEELIQMNNQLSVLSRENVSKGRKLEQHALKLEQALSKVKQLEGIIPICMYCKKIRDDEQLWHNMEKYITEHSEAEFSHGICPACFEKNFGEN